MRQTDYVVLGLLCEGPMTGYQIKRIVDIRFRFFWNESYGQLYPALKALRADGYIAEAEPEERRGRESTRAQKAYRLTAKGLEALRDWLGQPVEKESLRLEILLKMYFSHLTSPEVMLVHLEKFREAHEKDLRVLRMFETELKAIEDDDPAHPAMLRVVDFGIKANMAYLDWCRETAELLNGRKSK